MSGDSAIVTGARTVQRVPVGVGLNGAELALYVHTLRGGRPGPTLAVLSTLHGGEWYSIPPLRALVNEIDLSGLRGTVVLVPVGNPPAFVSQTRNPIDEADSPDLNRILPGRLTRFSDQLAAVLAKDVLATATHVIDLHSCPWGSAALEMLVGVEYTRPGIAEESQRIALAFGLPSLRRVDVLSGIPGVGSSLGYAGEVLGVPSILVEIGGAGFGPRLDSIWHRATIDGVTAVMRAIGMIDGGPRALPPRQFVCRRLHHMHPSRGGILTPAMSAERLGTEVARGTLLGTVISPYSHAVVEELRVPVNGVLTYAARSYAVRPGDWGFGVADGEDAASFWIDNEKNASDVG